MNLKTIAGGAALFLAGIAVGSGVQSDKAGNEKVVAAAAADGGTRQHLTPAPSEATATTTAAPTTTTQAPTTTTTDPPTTTTTKPAPKWVSVASLSGSATKQGTSFTLEGGEQRLSYVCRGTGGGGCIFAVNEGEYSAFHTSPDHAGADTTMMHLDPGTYYFEVDVIGSWTFTVKVEELR